MINFLLNILYKFLNTIIGIFPTGTGFDSSVHSAFTTLGSYLGVMDVFVPISIMLYCLTTVFSVEIALFGFKTVKWIISHIPWFGGKGNH